MDIHQSASYSRFMQKIGWTVEKIDSVAVFIKKLPLIGSVIKIQRPDHIPSASLLKKLKEKHRAFSLVIEPDFRIMNHESRIKNFKISNTSYLPTKTIHIDLKKAEEQLFKSFSESTRRAVRRAMKNNLVIKESTDIDAFIELKGKSFWPLGFLFTRDIKPLWQTMYPQNATLLLAKQEILNTKYLPRRQAGKIPNTFLAGILLLFSGKTLYYWLAVSTKEGNSVAAPSLLVWEALKLGKKKRCTVFDFEGIYDERFPNINKEWLGFSKFKKGFGGKEIEFPTALSL